MEQQIVWQTLYTAAVEHLRFREDDDGGRRADGKIVGVVDDHPLRLAYNVMLDAHWQVRQVIVDDLLRGATTVHLRSDGAGRWHSADGTHLPQFDGCIDIDFTATPFTNTLPIRRLPWQVGATHDLRLVYIVHPQFELSVAAQTYTCLATSDDGARFHFKMDDFEREITVDAAGFVVDYPDLFRRAWAARLP